MPTPTLQTLPHPSRESALLSLTSNQRRFAKLIAIEGDSTDLTSAYMRAYPRCTSTESAHARARKLLADKRIVAAINFYSEFPDRHELSDKEVDGYPGLRVMESMAVEEYFSSGFDIAATARALNVSERWVRNTLARDNVQDAINRRAEARISRLAVNSDRIIQETAAIALADPRDLFREDGTILPPRQWSDGIAAAIARVEVTSRVLLGHSDDDAPVTDITTKVWFHSKTKALEMLYKTLGLFREDALLERALDAWTAQQGDGSDIADHPYGSDQHAVETLRVLVESGAVHDLLPRLPLPEVSKRNSSAGDDGYSNPDTEDEDAGATDPDSDPDATGSSTQAPSRH